MIGFTALRRSASAGAALVVALGLAAAIPTATAAAAPSGSASAAGSVTQVCADVPGRNHCMAEVRKLTAAAGRAVAAHHADNTAFDATFTGYSPAQLRTAYGIPLTDTHQTIAVVDAYDDATAESDLAAYRSAYGLSPCTTLNGCFRKVNQAGGSILPRADANWAQETSMDIELVSAICPSCRILLVESTDDDSNGRNNMEIAARYAGHHADYVSMSWGTDEDSSIRSMDAYFDKKTTAYVASAGDNNYGVSWPASSPRVTAVGGTTLTLDASGARTAESTWSHNGSGTGSGCSSYEAQPWWQKAAVSGTNCFKRAVADVSAVADPDTGPSIYLRGSWYLGGGTSAAAPIITAMQAVANTTGTGDNPVLRPYVNRSRFHDVHDGSVNGYCGTALCKTRVGWDGPTGIGSPTSVAAFAKTRASIAFRQPGTTSIENGLASVTLRAVDSQSLPVAYSATGLPTGVTVSGGRLVGRPVKRGTYRVTVTAHDSSGATATSRFTWTVKLGTITTSATPNVLGSTRVGATVRVHWGTFRSSAGDVIRPHAAIQWLADGRVIRGATRGTLKVTKGLSGKHLSYTLTATLGHYNTLKRTSGRSATVS